MFDCAMVFMYVSYSLALLIGVLTRKPKVEVVCFVVCLSAIVGMTLSLLIKIIITMFLFWES
jgi:hypothetical protein